MSSRVILISGAKGLLGQVLVRAFLGESPQNHVCLGIQSRLDRFDALCSEFSGHSSSAPFDNWWHDAYGLDVKMLCPPPTVLALGMWAVVLGAL